MGESSSESKQEKNGGRKQVTPPSPRRGWMKLGGSKSRSVENMPSLAQAHPSRSPRPRSPQLSPPLTLATGSPAAPDANFIPAQNHLDTPPKKLWEHNFRSFLSRRSQHQQPDSSFPPVPLIAPREQLQQQQKQVSASKDDAEENLDHSVRGGKFFKSIFNSNDVQKRKTKSCNELDEPRRNGSNKNYAPNNSNDYARFRKVQSHANVMPDENDDLNESMRRASFSGNGTSAIVPSSQTHAQQQYHHSYQPQHYYQPQQHHYHQRQEQQIFLKQRQQQQQHPHADHVLLSQIPPSQYPPYSLSSPHHSQHHVYNGSGQYQFPTPPLSPGSAQTEIKKAFTEFHNSSKYAADTASAYLGDEPSGRFASFNPGVVVQSKFGQGPHGNARQTSSGSIGNSSTHRFLSSSLPTVDENVSIHKNMRMLRPFQMVDTWQTGRRYLIGPAALVACPLLNGISSLSLSASHHTRDIFCVGEERNKQEDEYGEDDAGVMPTPHKLPPLFGCIVLGKALLSYVVQEPSHHQQQRWWSSCILVVRQNYLLEYDEQSGDLLQGLPRGYAHLQYATCYPHRDFNDALELEFFVSPCAKADRRVLTIRCDEAREKRDNWIICLNRAARLAIKDLYDYDESTVMGRGRYAVVYPAKRRIVGAKLNGQKSSNSFEAGKCSHDTPLCSETCLDNYDCAIKVVDKKEFWRRVIKNRERADTLVREASVQSTMTIKCSKIPNFVRIRGFFETSDNVVMELELLEGTDLFNYVSSKGVLSENEAACITRDILTVLEGMNRAGLAHRDIKLANCLMRNCGSGGREKPPCGVKVADFGMSTFVGVDGLVRGRCGTPGYCAPEVFSAGVHGGYSNKVDVFSAGVTLYVMLCGYEPFYGESDAELIAANKAAKLEFPSNDWKQVSAEAKDLVKRMMAANPDERVSAKEALQHAWILKHTQSSDHGGVQGTEGASQAISNSKGETCLVM